MKTFFTCLIFLFVFITTNMTNAQLLVNTTWQIETGMPDPDIAWTATIANGPFGGPIVVGNTISENEGTNIQPQ